MMATIRTQAELDAEIDAKFPNNTQGLISAQRLRDYLKDVNASLIVQRTQTVEMTTDPYVVPVSEVTENILHTSGGSDRIVTLPDATTAPDQVFVMLTTDNSLVTVQSVSPITGDVNFTEPVLVSYRANGGEWFSLPLYLSRKDTVELGITFNEPGSLTAGEEMRIGNTEGQNNQGWVVPFAGRLTKMSISRGDSDLAEVDISVNGAIVTTVVTAALKSTHGLDVPMSEGDSLMVLGGAATPNAMTQPVVVLVLTKE